MQPTNKLVTRESKYNITDTVWLMVDNKPTQQTVWAVLGKYGTDRPDILYYTADITPWSAVLLDIYELGWTPENELFPTKAELIASL